MPTYDFRCEPCSYEYERFSTVASRNDTLCPLCNGKVERLFKPNAVRGDDIPGGVLIENALCNPDGSPRRYYSHSEIKREAEKRGWTNVVRHQPKKGSDKSDHTTRWY